MTGLDTADDYLMDNTNSLMRTAGFVSCFEEIIGKSNESVSVLERLTIWT